MTSNCGFRFAGEGPNDAKCMARPSLLGGKKYTSTEDVECATMISTNAIFPS